MNHQTIREQAYEANMAVVKHGLVIFTWGNASSYDAQTGFMAIKPSGVAYEELSPSNMVVLEVQSGNKIDSANLKPSSDTATHLALYRAFKGIGGIVHTHSPQATAWAQAGLDLPCYGTTHADYFYGAIPCTAAMTPEEIYEGAGYEHNTGEIIVREFKRRGIDPMDVPAVLVRNHAPFVWGKSADGAAHNAVVLETVAAMARNTVTLAPRTMPISQALLDKHFKRKHGPGAYYGQK